MSDHAQRIASALSGSSLDASDVVRVRELVTPHVAAGLLGSVDVYRVLPTEGQTGRVAIEPLVEVAIPTGPQGYSRAGAERLAERVAAGSDEDRQVEPLAGGADVVRSAAKIVAREPGGEILGVVVASDALTGSAAFHSRRISGSLQSRIASCRVLQRPLAGVYLSFFLMLTLMILISATWMGVYIAKTHHPAGCSCSRPGLVRLGPGISTTESNPRVAMSSGRSWMRSTPWQGSYPQAADGSSGPDETWNGRTKRANNGGTTSRPFSSGSQPVSCRWTPRVG